MEDRKSGTVAAADALLSVELTLADLEAPDAFRSLFRRPGGTEMEIGCGKGRFIIRSAQASPDADFLGVERANRFLRIALERANRRQLANLRLIRADATYLLRQIIPAGSLRAIHVLFPDPWPKKRHHKRRLFQELFIELVERALSPGGELNVATDHAGYWQAIEALLRSRQLLQRLPAFRLVERLPAGETGHTNYEVKYRAVGREIFQASWVRLAPAS